MAPAEEEVEEDGVDGVSERTENRENVVLPPLSEEQWPLSERGGDVLPRRVAGQKADACS